MDRFQKILVECQDAEEDNANHNNRAGDANLARRRAVSRAMTELFKRVEALEKIQKSESPF